jgi:hypothetical protein
MPGALYVVLDRELQSVESIPTWRSLRHAQHRLSTLCRSLGVRELTEFVADNPEDLADELEDDLDLLGEVPVDANTLASERWFPAADGLATVEALLERLREEPGLVRESDHVLGELDDLAGILREAEAHHVPFHLAVEPDRRRSASRSDRRRGGGHGGWEE